jgi:hypothetical protein
MNLQLPSPGILRRLICIALAATMAVAPSANVVAQTYGAQQAVRQRVQGLGGEPSEQPAPPPGPAPGEHILPPSSTEGRLDTRYVAPNATAIVVVRPAQLVSMPLAELLPTEVASAAGLAYAGIDPASVDEVVAFLDLSSPMGLGYGLTIKFNEPFRAASIPLHVRPSVQLAELAGRKYWQSAHPMFPSFYGTNRTTLIAAPEATLRQLVDSAGQASSGPLLDRLRDVPAGADLYAAVDVASLRPMIQMGMAQAPAQVPANLKPLLELPNLIAAAEFTVNLSNPGPTSLVLHANDEAAAQQIETMLQEASSRYQASPQAAEAALADPIAQAMVRYRERMSRPFTPQRNGATVTCFHIDGQNPAQQQLAVLALIGVAVALSVPALQKAREVAKQAMPGQSPEQPPAANPPAEQPVDPTGH